MTELWQWMLRRPWDTDSYIHRVKWCHISVVAIRSPFCWATPSYCVWLTGEDLSRYSNKDESVGLRNVRISAILLKKSDVRIRNISQSLPTKWRKNSCHGCDMKKLRRCHPMYNSTMQESMYQRVTDRETCCGVVDRLTQTRTVSVSDASTETMCTEPWLSAASRVCVQMTSRMLLQQLPLTLVTSPAPALRLSACLSACSSPCYAACWPKGTQQNLRRRTNMRRTRNLTKNNVTKHISMQLAYTTFIVSQFFDIFNHGQY